MLIEADMFNHSSQSQATPFLSFNHDDTLSYNLAQIFQLEDNDLREKALLKEFHNVLMFGSIRLFDIFLKKLQQNAHSIDQIQKILSHTKSHFIPLGAIEASGRLDLLKNYKNALLKYFSEEVATQLLSYQAVTLRKIWSFREHSNVVTECIEKLSWEVPPPLDFIDKMFDSFEGEVWKGKRAPEPDPIFKATISPALKPAISNPYIYLESNSFFAHPKMKNGQQKKVQEFVVPTIQFRSLSQSEM